MEPWFPHFYKYLQSILGQCVVSLCCAGDSITKQQFRAGRQLRPDQTQPVTRQNPATRRTVFIKGTPAGTVLPGSQAAALLQLRIQIIAFSTARVAAAQFVFPPSRHSRRPAGNYSFSVVTHKRGITVSGPLAGQPVVQHCLCS